MTELSEYHYNLLHKPGKTHGKPDGLSRRPDLKKGEDDNKNVILLKEEHFRQHSFLARTRRRSHNLARKNLCSKNQTSGSTLTDAKPVKELKLTVNNQKTLSTLMKSPQDPGKHLCRSHWRTTRVSRL
jgi:hypothetical protein